MNSKRIKLINCDLDILKSVIRGDDYLSRYLNIEVPENWTTSGKKIFTLALQLLSESPSSKKWWIYLPIEISSNTLIGSCGFKGEPDKDGLVEIGYEVTEKFQNKGFATEITKILTNIAFQEKKVSAVIAHTVPKENASVKVLKKCGFQFVKAFEDKQDGLLWEWKKDRNTLDAKH